MLVALLGAASGGLAGAAADVLSEIVLKRMDSTAKLRCQAPAGTLSYLECLTPGHFAGDLSRPDQLSVAQRADAHHRRRTVRKPCLRLSSSEHLHQVS